jgi:2',3'-cyclic-nucleotide 2'-phosphodiesterase (5'-nucleotidase family)
VEKERKPTLRIYAVAGAAGAIEPCGCVKDMLGGIDHAAAFISSQKKSAPHSIVVGAGPMFFEGPTVEQEERKQALFKAEAMASSLHDLGLVAWAPGANDWALGVETFSSLTEKSKAHALAGNLPEGAGPVQATHVVSAGGMKIGLVGISVPEYPRGKVEFSVEDATAAAKKSLLSLEKKGVGSCPSGTHSSVSIFPILPKCCYARNTGSSSRNYSTFNCGC